jgi:cbb3-type cytochrome oxidase subunit 3
MGLSGLGIFHTVIGIAAIVSAIVGFVKYGKINLDGLSGKIYFYATIITSVTALGISKHGGFNAGHVFSLFIILLITIAYFLYSRKKKNNRARYLENFLLSFSFFLSLIPTINETFTRVPMGDPLAKDVKDPIIAQTLLVLFILFIAGAIFQYVRQKKSNNKTSPFYLEE